MICLEAFFFIIMITRKNYWNRKTNVHKSIYTGLTYDFFLNKWRAKAIVNGKLKQLGAFAKEKDAVRVMRRHFNDLKTQHNDKN